MSTAVVFSRDPGATQQLIALLEALRIEPAPDESAGLAAIRAEWCRPIERILIYARPPGAEMWRQAGFTPEHWHGSDDRSAQDLLASAGAHIVLTGTSDIDEPGDRALWRAARAAGIASHVVLDQRVNLAQRFMDASGTTTFPDWIYVSDDDYAAALTAIGMPRDGIRVTGDFHLARESRRFAQLAPAAVSTLRATWDSSKRRQIILFVSECGREMAAAGRPMHSDEVAELEKLLAELENGGHPAIPGVPCDEVCLVVRPHPRDKAGKYDGYLGRRPSGLEMVVSAAGDAVAAIAAADVIVGMNSSLLHEAKALGRPAVSLTGHPLGNATGATR